MRQHEAACALDSGHISTAYETLWQMARQDEALLNDLAPWHLLELLERLVPRAQNDFTPQQICTVIRACGHFVCPAAAAILVPRLLQPDTLLGPGEFSPVLVGLARARVVLEGRQLQLLVQALLQQLPHASATAVGNSVWALGELGAQLSQGSMRRILRRFTQPSVLSTARPRDIQNVMSAAAAHGCTLSKQQVGQLLAQLRGIWLPAYVAADVLQALKTMGGRAEPEHWVLLKHGAGPRR